MGYEWAHSGSVRLKPGTTLQDVLNLFPCDSDEPHLPLHPSGVAELEDGQVWIKVEHDFLEYRADGDRRTLDEAMTDFLKSVAHGCAADGWIDYEIGDYEVPYGPTELARALARLESARFAQEAATREVSLAEEHVRRISAAQA